MFKAQSRCKICMRMHAPHCGVSVTPVSVTQVPAVSVTRKTNAERQAAHRSRLGEAGRVAASAARKARRAAKRKASATGVMQ